MLPRIVHETLTEVKEYQRKQQQENQIQHIKDTHSELLGIRTKVSQIVTIYELMRSNSMLPDEQQEIFNRITDLSLWIEDSMKNFLNHDYRQAPTLGKLSKSIDFLYSTLARSWMIYTQGKVQPYKELAKIAEALPQMRHNIDTLQNLISQLDSATKTVPDLGRWTKFHSKLEELANLLGEIEGLSQDKRAFLNAALSESATLSNITPELLQWCNEIGLAESLVLRFKDVE